MQVLGPKARRGKAMMQRRLKHVHPMVANMAIDRIMFVYDQVMSNDALWKTWKEAHPGYTPKQLENAFLERNWGKAVEDARATLAAMLNPATSPSLDEEARIGIHEALVLDASLKMGRPQRSR